MNIEELRSKIDKTDAEIVRLIAERIRVVAEIGNEKKKQGKQIEDTRREESVMENIRLIAQQENISQQDIESIYQQIVNISRSIQGIVVAFQGEIGAYSEEAAFHFFGPSTQVKPCESLDDVFQAVEQNEVQYGIVPIENSLEGSISRVYDLLLDSSLMVCGETELRVSHCLIASPQTRLDLIKKVYSHPQALGQCQAFLKHLGLELIPTYDTAGSVKMIKEMGITDGAAIASTRAAEIYGMQILAHEIEDNQNNYTRFFILAKQDSPPSGNDKTSIVFSVKHRPGALHEFLKDLASRNVNLTKIESRPTRQKPWEYNFYFMGENLHPVDFGSPGAGNGSSENNDPFTIKDGQIVTLTNNAGGILGGISNGMPIVLRLAIKPTPSIARSQETVNIQEMQSAQLEVKGRHDTCIVPRAVPAVEAMMAITIADFAMRAGLIPRVIK